MRILTWNVWGRTENWQQRQRGIDTTLQRLRPDVIALQETWRDADASPQIERLSQLLQYHAVTAHPPCPAVTDLGLAIMSRWPISDRLVHELPSGDAEPEHRVALTATVHSPAGPLAISTTHLNWQLDHSHIREEQLSHLVSVLSEDPFSGLPLILCGDMNAGPVSDEVRSLVGLRKTFVPKMVFLDAWDVAGDGTPGYTWSHRNPQAARKRLGNWRLDYIFLRWAGASPILHTEVVDGDQADGQWPSDHLGVLTELDPSALAAHR
jgi:endonuclease/exonuclease/phosphatase family metal-dependent hydrolase